MNCIKCIERTRIYNRTIAARLISKQMGDRCDSCGELLTEEDYKRGWLVTRSYRNDMCAVCGALYKASCKCEL